MASRTEDPHSAQFSLKEDDDDSVLNNPSVPTPLKAQDIAESVVTYRMEIVDKKAIIPFSYDLKNGDWMNKERTVEQLFDADESGADRVGRITSARTGMNENPNVVSSLIISEELGSDRNYLYVYNRVGDTIQACAIEVQGDEQDLQRVQQKLSVKSSDTDQKEVHFSRPLFFTEHITPQDILSVVQEVLPESALQRKEYIHRLTSDVRNFDWDVLIKNREVEKWEHVIQEEIAKHDDIRQGFSALTTALREYAQTPSPEKGAVPDYGPVLNERVPDNRAGQRYDVMSDAFIRVGGEIGYTIDRFRFWRKEQSQKKEKNPFLPIIHLSDSISPLDTPTKKTESVMNPRVSSPKKEVSFVIERIEKQRQKMEMVKQSFYFIHASGVGVGGVFVLLETLREPVKPITKKEKQELRKMKRKERSISQKQSRKKEKRMVIENNPLVLLKGESKQKTPVRKSKETRHFFKERHSGEQVKKQKKKEILRAISRRNVQTHLLRRIEMTGNGKKQKETRGAPQTGPGRKERKQRKKPEKLTEFFSGKEWKMRIGSREKMKREKMVVFQRERALLIFFHKITRKIRMERQREKTTKERNIKRSRMEKLGTRERKEKEKRIVLVYVQALILFILLKPFLYEKHHCAAKKQKANIEGRLTGLSSQWILLSIIWHMSAIREQGIAVVPPKKKKKKKNKHGTAHTILEQGLIYRYHGMSPAGTCVL